jgi:hypothetical protein
MAIVANKDGQGIKANGAVGVVDRSYCTPNRSGAGVPAVPSLYASEIYLNTTTDDTYRAMETGTAVWALTING